MTTSTPTRIAAGVTAGYLRDLSRHPVTAVAADARRFMSGGDGLVSSGRDGLVSSGGHGLVSSGGHGLVSRVLERDSRAASRIARRRGSGADARGVPGRGHRGACSDPRVSSSSTVGSRGRSG
jgi:hypothetical protein